MSGKVYIASMNVRGKWAPRPVGAKVLNVTSVQATDSPDRRDFSPMTPVQGGYKGFWNFESYWQSRKVFEGLPHEKSVKWWKKQMRPRRRHPQAKKRRCLYSILDDKKMDYVESREQVYVPEYYEMVEGRERVAHWRKLVGEGKDVVVYDVDGPRDEDRDPICLEVTLELLKDKIKYTPHQFGHGYVVAGLVKGIHYAEYT